MQTRQLIFLLALASFTSIGAIAQVWTQRFPVNNPVNLVSEATAYDPLRGQVVLFGGFSTSIPNNFSNLTYVWDGHNWQMKNPNHSPSARQGAAMTFDAKNGQIVLFGGTDPNGNLGDTWAWDGHDWTLKSTSGPSPRATVMVYDESIQRVVLFSGNANYGDTWTWDGVAWTLVTQTGPSGRWGHVMAYDAARRKVVLFGGNGPNSETWTFDGSSWLKQTPRKSPPARFFAAMAWDSNQQTVVLFGGMDGINPTLGDTWTWNGYDWLFTTGPMPGARFSMAMAYDQRHSQMLLFGGEAVNTPFSDTWVTTSAFAAAGSPQSAPAGRPLPYPMEVLVIGANGIYKQNVPVAVSLPRGFQGNQSALVTDINGRVFLNNVTTGDPGSYTVTATLPSGDFTTFSVSSVRTSPANHSCVVTTPADDDSPGSLRFQVAACGSGGLITFAPGITTVTLAHGQDIQLTQNVTIDGGPARVVIDAHGQSRIFFASGGQVVLRSLVLQNGLAKGGNGGDGVIAGGGAAGMGGAIFVQGGTLITSDVIFSGNHAQGGSGGTGRVYENGGVVWGGGGGVGTDSVGIGTTLDTYSQGGGGGDLGGSTELGNTANPYTDGSGAAPEYQAGFGGGGGAVIGDVRGRGAGFGGGAGASDTQPDIAGAFGGLGDNSSTIFPERGGGGAGLGGAVFVRHGLLLMYETLFDGNSAVGGPVAPGSGAATSGQGKGGALFISPSARAAYFVANPPMFAGNFADAANSRDLCNAVLSPNSSDSSDVCGVMSPVVVTTSGAGQSALLGSPFPHPLVVTLTVAGSGVSGLPITFRTKMDGGPEAVPGLQTVNTDSNGTASVVVSANNVAGSPGAMIAAWLDIVFVPTNPPLMVGSFALTNLYATTTTSLSIGTTTVESGQKLTASVTVHSDLLTPGGTVTVAAASGPSCTATLTNGAGTCSLVLTKAGLTSITATYPASLSVGGSKSSQAVTVTDFVMDATPLSQQVSPPQTLKWKLSFTPIAGYDDTLSLRCTVDGSPVTCTFGSPSFELKAPASQTVSHSFGYGMSPGDHKVAFIAQSSAGVTRTQIVTVSVGPMPPPPQPQ